MANILTDAEIAGSDETLSTYLGMLIRQCEDHSNYQKETRLKSLEYYNGDLRDMAPEKNRSKVISNDLRATYKKLMPSIMRTLLANDKVVEFLPSGPLPQDHAYADQATDYINGVIVKQDDYGVETALHDAIFDALIVKTGILTWDAYEESRVEVYEYENRSEQDMLGLQGPGLEIMNLKDQGPGQDGAPRYSFHLRRTYKETKIKLCAVPRGSFLIMPDVDSIRESPVVGERIQIARSDLVSRGYDSKQVMAIAASSTPDTDDGTESDQSAYLGDEYSENRARQEIAKSVEEVTVYRLFVKLDRDEDGIAEIYKFMVGDNGGQATPDGENRYVILEDQLVYEYPYAKVISEREPHQFEGHSLSEDVIPIMQVKTQLLRETLNNIYWQNDMQPAIDQSKVIDVDDILEREFGRPIWLKNNANVRDALQWAEVPFVAEQTFNMLTMMDQLNESHTGVTDASGGVDLERFQSMSSFNAGLINEVGTATSEAVIRTLSRGGIRNAFRGLLKLVIAYADGTKMHRVKGQWMPFDPRLWDSAMDCVIHVGLGAGSREKDMLALKEIESTQANLITAFGKRNPFVTPENIYNTLARKIEVIGMGDASTFFKRPSQQEVEALLQAEDNKPSPEQVKAQTQLQIAREKAQAQLQIERGQLEADITVKKQELEAKIEVDREKVENTREIELLKYELRAMEQRQELMMERERHLMEMAHEREEHHLDIRAKEIEHVQRVREARMDNSAEPRS